MDDSLIYKYLSNEASEAETKQLFEWIDKTPENRKVFFQYKKSWALTSYSQDNEKAIWKNLNKETFAKNNDKQYGLTFFKYAAAAVVIFALGILTQYLPFEKTPQTQVYFAQSLFEVPLGQMSKVTLPDGTVAHLNSGSKLYYDTNFSSGKRQVKLEGEAFFDVKTDKQHPFIILTPKEISLKVYGTSFNVQAYPNEDVVNTTLVEGSLGLIDKSGKELTKLQPGENAKYRNDENRVLINKVNTEIYTSWKEGLVTFRDESLKDIALKIERWYNVEIIFSNKTLENHLYNGTILKNKPIDQILEVFKLTSSLNYKIVYRTDKPTLIYWN